MCLAVPGRVLRITQRDGVRMGDVDLAGIRREVCLEYLPDVEVGEYVVVHAGFAVQRLDEESAGETLSLLDGLGLVGEGPGDGSTPRRVGQ
jgi:hydrogenase expression/formation protein HypC